MDRDRRCHGDRRRSRLAAQSSSPPPLAGWESHGAYHLPVAEFGGKTGPQVMDGRVRALERANEVREAFIVYDAEWHFDDDLAAVGHPECKPAFRLTYARFEELYESGWRPGQDLRPRHGV